MENKTQGRSLSIKNWDKEDRPREKLILKGKASLSNAELITILIGSGTKSMSALDIAKLLLNDNDNSINKLAQLEVKDLIKYKGIGEAKAISIVSALELGRRREFSEENKKVKISSSKDAYECIKPHILDLKHEEFWILILNVKNEVLKKHKVSAGGVSKVNVDSRMIFKPAIEENASAVVLIHNHPTGYTDPSDSDKKLTSSMAIAGKYLNINVLDHIICANHSYFSFADEGLLI